MAATSYIFHLSARAARFPGSPALVLPVFQNSDSQRQLPDEWRTVTYGELWDDVVCTARWYTAQFSLEDIHPGSVVALWVKGLSYSDVVHLFALSLGGFIPLILSLNPSDDSQRIPAWHLMRRVDAKALVYDPTLINRAHILSAPLDAPRYPTVDFETLVLDRYARAVRLPKPKGGSSVAFVMHTSPFTSSSSTSSSPSSSSPSSSELKPVMVTHQLTVAPALMTTTPDNNNNNNHHLITTRIGSITLYEGLSELLRVMLLGGTTVLPSTLKVSVVEVRDIVQRCKVNALAVESGSLADMLTRAWTDRDFLRRLKEMDYIMASGPPLPPFAQQWIVKTGFKLVYTRVSAENIPEVTALLPRPSPVPVAISAR